MNSFDPTEKIDCQKKNKKKKNEAIPITANLMNSAVNLAILREYDRKELIRIINSVPGEKELVLDPSLSGPLDFIIKISHLKKHGIEKIYYLGDNLDTECENLIYLIRSNVDLIKFIANHIRNHEKIGQYKKYYLFFVPKKNIIMEKHLENEGIDGKVIIGEYHIDFIILDRDLLSLELDDFYQKCFLENDMTYLYCLAQSIMRLQFIFGIIPHIKAIGTHSEKIVNFLLRMCNEIDERGINELKFDSEIDTLILIDRQVDMITPMCTQLTYEGLIDELFGINSNCVNLESKLFEFSDSDQLKEKIKIPLNSNNKIYSQLRNLNLAGMKSFLTKKINESNQYYQKRHELSTASELGEFRKNLKSYYQEQQIIKLHLNIIECIADITKQNEFRQKLTAEQNMLAGNAEAINYIEECIYRNVPLLEVLRLLSIFSLTHGLSPEQYHFFWSEIFSMYGYQHLLTANTMKKLGLIQEKREKKEKPIFQILRKPLNLVVPDVNEIEPDDIAYVYSGYAPLSVRLIEFQDKWKKLEYVTNLFSEPIIEKEQETSQYKITKKNKTVLVFFIGGITFTEISAIRYLNQINENINYMIATTKIINGNSLLFPLIFK